MNNSFRSIIDSAKEILILLPVRTSFDSVAAGLSLFLSLQDEKPVHVSSPAATTVEYNRLVGVNKIKSELGGKNLVIRIVDYPAKQNIEKVAYDIDASRDEMELRITPKDGVNPPSTDQVVASFAGLSADTVILVGGVNHGDFPALSSEDFGSAKVVHIGNQELERGSAPQVLSLARPASSVSEIIASLINESALKLDPDIATNLLAGIKRATNNLTSDGVTADTYETVAGLMRKGAKKELQEPKPRFAYPPGAIPGQYGRFPQKPNPFARQPEPETKEDPGAPKDWLQPPKIYKGGSDTSIS